MVGVEPQDEWGRRALTFLRTWDQVVAAESVGACVYELFFAHIVRRALEEKLGSWSDFYMGKGIHPSRPNGLFFVDAASWLAEKVRERPDWFDGRAWRGAGGGGGGPAGGGGGGGPGGRGRGAGGGGP